jgi:DNA-binding HxlR family transcriptional regulator
LEVAFDDLGSSITVAQYLDVPWDSRRFMQLRHMQVQIEPKWLKQQIRRLTMKEAA